MKLPVELKQDTFVKAIEIVHTGKYKGRSSHQRSFGSIYSCKEKRYYIKAEEVC